MPAPDYAVEIAALETALANNTLEVQYGGFGGDRVMFASSADILLRLNYFRTWAATNAKAKSASTLAAFERD